MRSLTWRDRAFAWLVTGPVGRVVAFALDLAAALTVAARSQLTRGRSPSRPL